MGVFRLQSIVSNAKQLIKLNKNQRYIPKGYSAVYVGEVQKKRFVVPLSYLDQPLFQDLLRRSEDEFGFNHPMGGLTILCREEAFVHLSNQLHVSYLEKLSVYFENEFGTIGEILGLSKQDGEEIKRCYINYLDIFTSYYKTARVPKEEHNTIPSMPTGTVEKGKGYICPAFHQCDFGDNQAPNKEAVSKKGKEKMEHFGIELEDTRYEPDSFSPIHPSIKGTQTMNKDNQGMIKGPIKSEFEVKEETDSNSSEGFTIISIVSNAKQLIKLNNKNQRDIPKGYLAVYVGEVQKKRFVVPLSYLDQPLFQDLLRRSEDEFGFNHPMGGLTILCREEAFVHLSNQLHVS
ncbi:ARID DNA-binding domain-containing protein [Tanacetum coccineum]